MQRMSGVPKKSADWGFRHVNSSPHYPRSNEFVERQIQTIKNTFRKAKRANEDVELALLVLRTTPIDQKLPSPAELLFNRSVKDTLPIHTSNWAQSRDEVISRLNERQEAEHDRSARDLPPLYKGQQILIQDQSTNRWKPAQLQNVCEEQQDEGGVVRRNQHQLCEKSASFDIDDKTYYGEKNHACQPPAGTADNPYMTRSGREVRSPD